VYVTFADGTGQLMRLTRDLQPASANDVTFVSAARQDIQRLIAALRLGDAVGDHELAEIERRCRAASPGPWQAFLESDGGIGGSSVIRVSDDDDELDLYLWIGKDLAPDADFEFVASAREDIPRLLAALHQQDEGRGAG
jgi:hypothetical protein